MKHLKRENQNAIIGKPKISFPSFAYSCLSNFTFAQLIEVWRTLKVRQTFIAHLHHELFR